ncbi:hypothetical protein [Streptomyces echinatus]|uniref:Uncharacterized protein n=1 Tax=Streptomyces echinatus TaxID=67293 RepID=A0A7W9UV83_9ACTN|nr:hypothetical protein [Streptomyces echinatus]MBB5932433.1 hypothetical protein [Streptomyces echinatus]
MATTSGAGHPLPYDTYREAIERETRRFAETVGGADHTGAVPPVPTGRWPISPSTWERCSAGSARC